jgi:hypothetical protein
MDAPDFQFIDQQLTRSQIFLPENAFDLALYAAHLEQGALMLQQMTRDEAEDWFINEAARCISNIKSHEELQTELYKSLEAQDNVEEESKSDVAVQMDHAYAVEMAAITDARNDQADAARDLAFAYIATSRHFKDKNLMKELTQRVLQLLADVAVMSDSEESEESDNEEVGVVAEIDEAPALILNNNDSESDLGSEDSMGFVPGGFNFN